MNETKIINSEAAAVDRMLDFLSEQRDSSSLDELKEVAVPQSKERKN